MRHFPARLVATCLVVCIVGSLASGIPSLGAAAGPNAVLALTAVPAPTAPSDSLSALPALRIFAVERLQDIPSSQRNAAFSEYVLAARAALDRGDFSAALRMADRACLFWKRSRRPLLHRAAAQLALLQWSPAITTAREAATARADRMPPEPRADEGDGAAAYWEGLAFYRTQRYDEARPRLLAATTAAPEWAEAARAYAELCFVMGRSDEAAASYARALELDPEVGTARDDSYYADALVGRGDLEGGIAVMQRALRRGPYLPGLHANLGRLLRQDGDLTEAYYQFTLELVLHGARGPYAQKALEQAGQIIDLVRKDPKHPSRQELLLVSSGLGFLDEKRAPHAVHELEQAARITRSSTGLPQLLLGEALLRSGQMDAARRQLETVLRLEPDFVPALVLLGEALRALGEREQAQITVERAYALFPSFWRLHLPPK